MGLGSKSIRNKEIGGKNFLLIVGIDKYLYFRPLNNCVRDVKNITEILTTKYTFDHGELFLLLDEDATKKNIYRVLIELIELIQNNDNLVVYFAGHGDFNEKLDEGYWIPVEATPSEIDTYIPMSEFINFVNSMPAKHVLVISDSSFSYNLIQHGNRK